MTGTNDYFHCFLIYRLFLKSACDNFLEPKVTCSNRFFCPTGSLKQRLICCHKCQRRAASPLNSPNAGTGKCLTLLFEKLTERLMIRLVRL